MKAANDLGLLSLSINSTENGYVQCVKSDDSSVLEAGSTEEGVFDGVWQSSIVAGMTKLVR